MKDDFIQSIVYPEKEEFYNVYEEIKRQKLPLFLYGAGNLASNIIKNLRLESIQIEGLLIDGEENITFEKKKYGIKVYNFWNFINRSTQCNIIIAYAKGYRKKEFLEGMRCFANVYIIDNPFEHHKNIDSIYVKNNSNKLQEAYELFEDNHSKKSFCAFINARINHNIKWVTEVSQTDWDEFNNDVMFTKPDEIFLDIGAYDGGSIQRFLVSNNYMAKKIIGIEPDENNFHKLSTYIKSISQYNCKLYQTGCWSEKTKLPFNQDDKCSRLDQDSKYYIDVDKIDNICGLEEEITLYNMGISVAEYEILIGSKELIKKWHPKLIIFMGSARDELWKIPIFIRKLSSDYKIYLRFLTAMPSRFFLYAI